MERKLSETMYPVTHRLFFAEEEEGILSFFEGEEEILRFFVYPVGKEEAEVKAQDIGWMAELSKYEIIPEFVIRKITNLLKEAMGVLAEAGYPEVLFLAEKSSKFEEILGSTSVVQKRYSERLMLLPPEAQDTTRDCGSQKQELRYEEADGGYICRNADRSFYARIYPFRDGWYVCEVEVRYDKRRTGIATACMGILAERFLQVYLQVGSYNEPAVRLYEKLGYQTIEELCYYGEA